MVTLVQAIEWGAVLCVLAWVWMLLFRGGFWLDGPWLKPEDLAEPDDWPEMAVIIPARDEADVIGQSIESHARTAYPGRVSVILVDDDSRDGTAQIARKAFDAVKQAPGTAQRSLYIMKAPPLPAGWTGKLAAQHAGLQASHDLAPGARYVLLTDADIVHAPEVLGALVAKAQDDRLALVSLMAKLDARGLFGALLIPAFIFFFKKLYPFRTVNKPSSAMAGAAGGCMLVDRFALESAGGFEAIRGALIDDCSLARLIKGDPPSRGIWLGLSRQVVSLRDNQSLGSIWTMVSRTAFAQLSYSSVFLVGTVIGMGIIYLAGPLALLGLPWHGSTSAAWWGAAGWALMALAYVPTVRFYGHLTPAALLLPLAALLYTAMTIGSALAHWQGRGGAWKGRTYAPPTT